MVGVRSGSDVQRGPSHEAIDLHYKPRANLDGVDIEGAAVSAAGQATEVQRGEVTGVNSER